MMETPLSTPNYSIGLEESAILHASTDGIAKLTRDCNVSYVNKAAREILGPGIDPVGKNHWAVFPDMQFEGSPFVSHYYRAMDEGVSGQFVAYYGDPLNVWVDIKVCPLPDGIVAFFRDVTAQHIADRQKSQVVERLALAHHVSGIAFWEWNPTANTFSWDAGSSWAYGRPPEEMTSYEQIMGYLHEDDRAKVVRDLEPAVYGRGEYRSEFRVIWPDGSLHWILAFGRGVEWKNGELVSFVGINMDITERKLSESALIQSEKLAAVGRVAATIAHEINNPLESVTNLLYLAKHSESLDEARGYLETADVELRRASVITNETLRFHRQSTDPTAVTCDALIEGVLTTYASRLANSKVQVEKRQRSLRPVWCFQGEIRQVLSNLVGNAIDAMQATDGRLLLRSREGHDWKSGREGVILTVADTGPGMNAQTMKSVFDAFFTTKGASGSGLGLWISKEIVDRHEGKLKIRSSQRFGKSGTVFSLFLPFNPALR